MLLAQAMEEAGKVAIGRFVMRNKQYVAALRASGRQAADEHDGVRRRGRSTSTTIDELDVLDDIDVSAKEVKMAEALVDSLSADFDPSKYRDEYREQVLDLIERKAAGEEFELPAPAAEAPKVVDLMAALEASVKAAKDARKRHPAGGPHDDASDGDQADEAAGQAEARPQERVVSPQVVDHRRRSADASCR